MYVLNVSGYTIEDVHATQFYTIIDFNEIDMRIYLCEKMIIHRDR